MGGKTAGNPGPRGLILLSGNEKFAKRFRSDPSRLPENRGWKKRKFYFFSDSLFYFSPFCINIVIRENIKLKERRI